MGVKGGRRWAVLLLVALGAGLSGCVAQQKTERPAKLRVLAEPRTAVVYVDDYFIGPARKLAENPVALKPGKRRVTIEAPDHFPHDLEVELVPGVTTVEIALRPVPP